MEDPSLIFRGGKKILAPMVRAGTLPLRELSFRYGCDVVFSEELIDRSLMCTERVVCEESGTIDFVKVEGNIGDGKKKKVVFSTTASHGPCILQLGTAGAETALAASSIVIGDVDGIDVNMGCPKDFSLKGNMGAALLKDPQRASDIIRTLRSSLPSQKSVSCKVRLQDGGVEDTTTFVEAMCGSGANCVTLHGRTRDQRDGDAADWEHVRLVVERCRSRYPQCAFVINGDIASHEMFQEALQKTQCDSAMSARAALANCSVFRAEGPLKVLDVASEYVKLAEKRLNHVQNTKYVLQRMFQGYTRKESQYRTLLEQCNKATSHAQLQELVDLHNNQQQQESETKKLKR